MLRQASTTLRYDTPGRGFTEITGDIAAWLSATGIADGIVHLLCRHTSASLLIQENADPDVCYDLLAFFRGLLAPYLSATTA